VELEQIDNVICEIMYQDGPDRHIDGHEVITEFIAALLAGDGDVWLSDYVAKKDCTQFIDV
jgi:hypothetical protein